jgi:hypothetical protein
MPQCWDLWNVCSKLTIESKALKHPIVLIYKTMILLKVSMINPKLQDQACVDYVEIELKVNLHAKNAPRVSYMQHVILC